MLNLHTPFVQKKASREHLTEDERFAVFYHDMFDYPLDFGELIKWTAGKSNSGNKSNESVTYKNGYYFLQGREGLIYKKLLRKRISARKIQIAKKATKILSFIPTVKMVAITGSLAMQNSGEEGDIDLMIVTKNNSLWMTRLLVYLSFVLSHLSFRKPSDRNQKDKLCLNIWLDEHDLIWKKKLRNFYTAHEIAQIIPLFNKDKTYQKFLYKNRWILNYWPNSVKISSKQFVADSLQKSKLLFPIYRLRYVIEKLSYRFQKSYMKSKITRETITPTRALFHPQDWGEVVLKRLNSV